MDYKFFGLLLSALTITNFLVSSHAIRVGVATSSGSSISVVDFGAIGDGEHDDTQAFLKAWEAVCNAEGDTATLSVPGGKTFLLNVIALKGPCKSSNIHLKIQGKIVAPDNFADWKNCDNTWIDIKYVDGLTIDGQGEIDGRGQMWWDSARDGGNTCNRRPAALSLGNCKGLRLSDITHKDSPGNHISIHGCDNSVVSNIRIIAPKDSPNTDGIDISSTKNVQISDSIIGTGDDCIAIGSDTFQINITGIMCGPGHGISIGSLGKNGGEAKVEEIHVKNCTFKNTLCGARIKTWQGGKGYARKITYDQIRLDDANNPIIIDQYYCSSNCKNDLSSAVAVSDVKFSGFRGTSASDIAINLNCSNAIPCRHIVLENVDIDPSSTSHQKFVTSSCQNVQGTVKSVIPKVPCVSSN